MMGFKQGSAWKKAQTCTGGSKCCSNGITKKQIHRGLRRIAKQDLKKDQH